MLWLNSMVICLMDTRIKVLQLGLCVLMIISNEQMNRGIEDLVIEIYFLILVVSLMKSDLSYCLANLPSLKYS